MLNILALVLADEWPYVSMKQFLHVMKLDSKDDIAEKLCLVDAPFLASLILV